jgi:hypothetical protein
MKLDPKITKYAVELRPDLKRYVEVDGCLYTLMLKAMYRCVQASPFLYALIRSVREGFGYEASKTDQCVFRKKNGDKVFLLLLYVDDILAVVDAKEAKELKALLEGRFGPIVFEVNNKLSYLGMHIDVKGEGTTVGMMFYIKQILEGREVMVKLSPGTKATFEVNKKAVPLLEVERKEFHSTTAKLLYLAKRARPEEPTVRAYMDAAYALHADSKSHTGVVIYAGQTLVYVSSRKQKCMSKSPTEAELIGLTDNIGLVELFQEFVEFLTMNGVKTPVIYQDCQAVISLVTKGGGITRTKHLRARMHLGKGLSTRAGVP